MLDFDDPLPVRPRRVAVAGVSGVGKTTLAARIARVIRAPHIEIDALFHGENWQPRPSFLDDVRAFIDQPEWVTEWQYASARPLLSESADLLVWLDLPFARVTLPRVIERTLRRRMRREVLWNGNVEPPLHTFFTDREHIVRWAISTRSKYRTRIPELERAHPGLVIVRLRSQCDVEAWLSGPLARAAVASEPMRVAVGGSDRTELLRRLRESGIRLNEHAETLLRDINLGAGRPETLTLVDRSVAELGLADGGTLPRIFAAARRHGYALCPRDAGPYLRLALTAQEQSSDSILSAGRAPSGSLTVASEPLRTDDEYPKGFYLRVVDGEAWLRGYRCDDEFVFSPGDRFVFRLP